MVMQQGNSKVGEDENCLPGLGSKNPVALTSFSERSIRVTVLHACLFVCVVCVHVF